MTSEARDLPGFSWLHQSQRLLSALSAKRLLALLGALALGLLFSRTWKLISVGLLEDAVWGISVKRRLAQAALVAIGLVALTLVARAAARRGIRLLPWLVGLGVVGVVLAELRERLATGQSGLFIDRIVGRLLLMVHVYRADLAVLAGFTLLAGLLLSGPNGESRARYRVLQVLAVFLLSLAGLELAYFRSTAMLGDGFIVMFWLEHSDNIGFLLKNELDLGNTLIIVTYLLLVPMGAWLLTRLAESERLRAVWARRPVLALLVLGAGLLWLAPDHYIIAYPYKRIASQFHVQLVGDIVGQAWSHHAKEAKPGPPLADFRNLKLVPKPDAKRLNLVFIILESARAQSMTPYEPGLATTPFLAELAKKSLLVDDMNVIIPQTNKAWIAIFTGMYPVSSMMSAWSESSAATTSLPSLPRMLGEQGYQSGFFTSGHLKFENDDDVIKNRRFDVVKSEGDFSAEGFERSNYFGHEDRSVIKPSFEWVDSVVAQDKPFFLTLMTLTGHHDYQVPTTFKKVRYPGVTNESLNDYLNCLGYVDAWLREVMTEFERRKLLDSTVFFILGDHGQSFGEHGSLQHVAVVYREAVHIPALIYAPGLFPQGGRITGPRQQIDLLPSVAQALGYELKGGFLPGKSLLEPVEPERELFFTCWQERTCIGMRRGAYKYIFWYDTDALQAFDLTKDPDERNDLGPSLPAEQVSKLRQEMMTWQSRAVQTYLNAH